MNNKEFFEIANAEKIPQKPISPQLEEKIKKTKTDLENCMKKIEEEFDGNFDPSIEDMINNPDLAAEFDDNFNQEDNSYVREDRAQKEWEIKKKYHSKSQNPDEDEE
ncbi:MAG TPA: hypothetical protein PLQ36_00160 [Candidatus Gracilibacteria bacterium]|nr:hypothetical protein [Candidatus Gracilibacteria bacterium]